MARPVVAILLLVLGGQALAAGDPSADDVEAAKGHFQAGQVYFEKGEFKRALVEFREALRDVDRPELDYNLGKTYDRLGDAARAIQSYRRYLERRPSAEDRAAVEARVSALDAHVGTLVIESRIPGAVLRVDDEVLGAAELGQPIRITEGAHRVVAAKDGFQSRTVETEVVAMRQSRVAIDPVRTPSRWWIGVLVGGAALVAAISVVLAVTLGGTADPIVGNFSPGIQKIP